MGDLALPYVLPRIRNPRLESLKYANFLVALYERRRRLETLSARPIDTTIDLTTTCQLRCPYCAVGNGTIKRGISLMAPDFFSRLVGELSETTFITWYFSTGEPLLHKKLPELLMMHKDRELFSVISTNLSIPLSDEKIDALLRCGLGMISASVDGATERSYAKYRVGGKFGLVMDNLHRLARRKKELGLELPLIEWRFLRFRHNEDEVPLARTLAADIGVDLLEFFPGSAPANPPGDEVGLPVKPGPSDPISGPAYLQGLARRETTLQRYLLTHPATPPPSHQQVKKCDWLYFSGMIYPDGAFGPCCVVNDAPDDFTNFKEHPTFSGAWNSAKFVAARRMFVQGEPSGTVCDRCPMPDAQHYQFVQKVRGILRNAPDWALRVLAGAPDEFFFGMDYALMPLETAPLRERKLRFSRNGTAAALQEGLDKRGAEQLKPYIRRFAELAESA